MREESKMIFFKFQRQERGKGTWNRQNNIRRQQILPPRNFKERKEKRREGNYRRLLTFPQIQISRWKGPTYHMPDMVGESNIPQGTSLRNYRTLDTKEKKKKRSYVIPEMQKKKKIITGRVSGITLSPDLSTTMLEAGKYWNNVSQFWRKITSKLEF